MKVLEFHDLKPPDSLRLIFDGAFDPRATLERELIVHPWYGLTALGGGKDAPKGLEDALARQV